VKEISAGFIVYRKTPKELEFLVLYHRGGYWNFPKGKIENEERSFQTAVRELKEETGISRNEITIIPNFKTAEKFAFWKNEGEKNSRVFKIVIFYLAETQKSEIRLSKEHGGYAWFAFKDAMKILEKYKDSQRVLREAYGFLRHKKPKPN
jgi:8-oxo-dGTP pyrophosphatase MutT (NUDIX family)